MRLSRVTVGHSHRRKVFCKIIPAYMCDIYTEVAF
jgi:hypothetical protein